MSIPIVFQPKNRDELKNAVNLWCSDKKLALEKYGNISNWDTSYITSMDGLFYELDFNEDLSKWNTSNVENMNCMFWGSTFNGDLSNWDTSNVDNMNCMFYRSSFNGKISKWDTSNVTKMGCMFYESKFNQDISKWNTSKVKNMKCMFCRSLFNKDISNWDTSNVEHMEDIFYNSALQGGGISNWDFSSLKHKINYIGIKLNEKKKQEINTKLKKIRQKEMMFAKTLPKSSAMSKANWKHRGLYNVGGRTRALAFDVLDENDKKVSDLMNDLKTKGSFKLNEKQTDIKGLFDFIDMPDSIKALALAK